MVLLTLATDLRSGCLGADPLVTRPVYLDYAATTPVDKRVAQAMVAFLDTDRNFGNPSSITHEFGQRASQAVEQARNQVASLLGALPHEIIWTSGATESDNLAIFGACHARRANGKHVLTSRIEHVAVLDAVAALEREGFAATYIKPDANGCITAEAITDAMRPDTVLVSLMHANNEIGVVQDIAAIGARVHQQGALFHVDAAQSVGKVTVDLSAGHIDLMSVTAHKIYGPKGIGALYVRDDPELVLTPRLFGGGQEQGLRAGTLPTHQCVGMGQAFAIAATALSSDHQHIRRLRDHFCAACIELGGVRFNGHPERCVAGIVSITFQGIKGAELISALAPIAVSSGSACHSHTSAASHVLGAIGLSDEEADATVRFSIGRYTTDEDLSEVIARLAAIVPELRGGNS